MPGHVEVVQEFSDDERTYHLGNGHDAKNKSDIDLRYTLLSGLDWVEWRHLNEHRVAHELNHADGKHKVALLGLEPVVVRTWGTGGLLVGFLD